MSFVPSNFNALHPKFGAKHFALITLDTTDAALSKRRPDKLISNFYHQPQSRRRLINAPTLPRRLKFELFLADSVHQFLFFEKKKYFVKTKNHRFLRFEFPPKRPICSGVNKQFKFHDSSEAICASGTSVALCCAASHLMASFVSPKSSRHLTVRRPKSNEPVDKQFTPRPL